MGEVRVGTCAWSDHEGLYPPGLAPGLRLFHYAQQFDLVEADVSFYRPITAAMTARWVRSTPSGFIFDLKAPGLVTGHRPADQEQRAGALEAFVAALEPILTAGRLGAVLLQFPPWTTDTAATRDAIEALARGFGGLRLAVEFRHASWFSGSPRRTLDWLAGQGLVHVVADEPQVGQGCVPRVEAVTCRELSIMRLHGRNAATWYGRHATSGERFRYRYSGEEIGELVEVARRLARQATEVHVLFNNNYGSYAVEGARAALLALGRPPGGTLFPDER